MGSMLRRVPAGLMPMTTAIPPRWVDRSACSMVRCVPTTSNAKSTPPRAGDRLHAGHGVVARRVDDLAGADLLRPLELLRQHVHGDDLRRAHEPCRLDGVEAHATAAEHGDARARRDLGAVPHRAGAGEDTAAHEADDVERRVPANRDDALLEHHRARRVARHLEEVMERLTTLPKA